MKLLRAFIEASGFDIEEVHTKTYGMTRELNQNEKMLGGVRGELEFQGNGLYKEVTRHIDYKVTKRKTFDYKRHDEKVNLKIRLDVPLCKKPVDKAQDMVTMCEILIKHNMTCLDFVMEVGGKV